MGLFKNMKDAMAGREMVRIMNEGPPGMGPYEPGKTWNVKIDPNDASNVVFSQ